MNDPAQLERILKGGADKARAIATPFLGRLRHAVGLRNLAAQPQSTAKAKAKTALPSFKQYREADGRHYFKFVDAGGALLLQSVGFDSPQDAGRAVARLKQEGLAAASGAAAPAEGVSPAQVQAALAQLAAG